MSRLTFRMRTGYWDSRQLCNHLQIGAAICMVLTARAVAAGKVNNYIDLATCGSFPRGSPSLHGR